MSDEIVDIIEPIISDQYLNSSLDKISDIDGLFRSSEKSIIIKPSALQNSDYFLKIEITQQDGLENAIVSMRIVNSIGQNLNNVNVGCNLFFESNKSNGNITCTGTYFNHFKEAKSIIDQPLANVSGVIAPYEDALYTYVAKHTGKTVHRSIATGQRLNSRFVHNFLRRGYHRIPEIDEEHKGTVNERGGILWKNFNPTSDQLII